MRAESPRSFRAPRFVDLVKVRGRAGRLRTWCGPGVRAPVSFPFGLGELAVSVVEFRERNFAERGHAGGRSSFGAVGEDGVQQRAENRNQDGESKDDVQHFYSPFLSLESSAAEKLP